MRQEHDSARAIRVVVVPVAARFGIDGDPEHWLVAAGVQPREPALLAYAPTDGWAWTEVEVDEAPSQAATRLLESVTGHLLATSLIPAPDPEPTGFIESADVTRNVNLVYTAAVPTSTTEIPPPEGWRWVDMRSEAAAATPPAGTRDLVREHWYRALEQTTAARQLLPEFFTMGQLLDVYRAVWHAPKLDWGNFRRWATERNRGMLNDVEPAAVAKERDAQLAKLAAAEGWALPLAAANAAASGAAARSLAKDVFGLRTTTGLSPAALPLAAAALAPAALGAIAAVAGAVAYQRLQRGKQPDLWYSFAERHRMLDEFFRPRPTWKTPDSCDRRDSTSGGRRGRIRDGRPN